MRLLLVGVSLNSADFVLMWLRDCLLILDCCLLEVDFDKRNQLNYGTLFLLGYERTSDNPCLHNHERSPDH